ncbi:MAG: hypothetical protein ACRCVT_02490 [Leadbetterella sp.]
MKEVLKKESKEWWSSKRINYNLGLIASGIIAFFLYAVLGSILIAPYDSEFEITLFTIFFQGIAYLFMMGFANLFYGLGYQIDINFNKTNSETFRKRLYRLGYWFSFGLPFLVPVMVVVVYFIQFKNLK